MKPFNLKEALAGKPVVTREGVTVTNVSHLTDTKKPYFKVVAVVDGDPTFYHEDGIQILGII